MFKVDLIIDSLDNLKFDLEQEERKRKAYIQLFKCQLSNRN